MLDLITTGDVGIHVGVDNDGKGLVGAGNGEGDGRCGTGEFDNEEEANDALLVQAAKEAEALLAAGQIKRVSTREVSLNLNMDSGFGGDDGMKRQQASAFRCKQAPFTTLDAAYRTTVL